MIALLQRVTGAAVRVGGETAGEIGPGLLVLVGVERGDTEAQADRLAQRIVSFRIFPDEAGKMNRSIADVSGGLLVVPQFTLAADTKSGTRPGFSAAAAPADGERLFNDFVSQIKKRIPATACGRFGAHMQVSLVNDGPVTFWLQVSPSNRS